MRVERAVELPSQVAILGAEAEAEGFRNVGDLLQQWQDHRVRFRRPGELLAVATVEEELAGIGGVTEDIVDSSCLRMRRFFVRPCFRRRGVGKAIASYVLERARVHNRPIFVFTDTTRGAAFWEAIGFIPIEREKTTHVLPP